MPPEICPNCGAILPPTAKVCPECGSDEKTGWSETAYASSLGLPDENFNYDEFVKEEFNPSLARPRGIHWLWWLTALILVILFLIFCLH
ncbi:MAG: zinc ribbon domain-containing protein [Verrucomicrobiales bacterium]|nr:zinc ribbon domain-containing protein [Verrucomicrobiales bacterium]